MKKLIAIAFLMSAFLIGKAQVSCTAFNIDTDFLHYKINEPLDTTYVRLLGFTLTDTVNISNMVYTLSALGSNEVILTATVPLTHANSTNLTIEKAYTRFKKQVSIGLGYLPYTSRYRFTIKLYDLQHKEISTSAFEF